MVGRSGPLSRGFTLLDFRLPDAAYADADLHVACLEHVRVNLRSIAPEVPDDQCFYLIVSGTAHSIGDHPLLVAQERDPASFQQNSWDLFATIDRISEWARANESALLSAAATINAPTRAQLDAQRIHPAGPPSA